MLRGLSIINMRDNMAYIEFKNIDKYFGKQHVLKNLSLSVESVNHFSQESRKFIIMQF